jgi:Tfp pilus assembly protein PilX
MLPPQNHAPPLGLRIPAHLARAKRARRGAALIMVLVCLSVAVAAVLGMLRSAIVEQQQLRSQRQQLQAARLAEAGIERAYAQLRSAATYSGEVWKVSAEELGGADAAAVTIRVDANKEQPQERVITVQADYPNDPTRHVRKNLEAKLILENEKVQP